MRLSMSHYRVLEKRYSSCLIGRPRLYPSPYLSDRAYQRPLNWGIPLTNCLFKRQENNMFDDAHRSSFSASSIIEIAKDGD